MGQCAEVRFRAVCAGCGEIATDPTRVSVVVDAEHGETFYEFECPRCHANRRVLPTPATVELLVALGATVSVGGPGN